MLSDETARSCACGRGAISEQKGAKSPVVVNFLSDHPSEEDHFGPHSRVADAVAETIGRDGAIRVIGLLGGWGSGKSTVVRHIEKRLGGGDTLHFFNYDAWLHQNDPPRRAFLEALIGNLTAAEHITPSEWEPRLAELSGKAEETKTVTTRQFSETGRAIFLAFAFVPFGLAFLDFDLIDRAFGSGGRGIARPLLAISLLAILAPLLVVLRFYFKWRPWPKEWKAGGWKTIFTRSFWREHDAKHKGKSVVALLTNRSVEHAENRTRISPDPTAIEFRSVFNDLLAACWAKNRRLVIVIDNLDRLAENDAMQLWATIRSLFLGNNDTLLAGAALPAPTIILPIDATAIQRMFATQHQADEAERLAESFIDKTFDITFQINEPVMSDWRVYFADKLREAFGPLATSDHIYWATKIIERANPGTAASKRITPRKLIKLINGVGALLVQWGDGTIDLLTMILYVNHRADISKDVAAFVEREDMIVEAPVPDWRRQLLALHFGVAPDKAFQTLLADPIRAAIASNDADAFASLLANPGAPEITEEVIAQPSLDEDDGEIDPNFIMNAVLLLAGSSARGTIWSSRALVALSRHWEKVAAPKTWRADFVQVLEILHSVPGVANPFVTASARILGKLISLARFDDEGLDQVKSAMRSLRTVAQSLGLKSPQVAIARKIDDLFLLIPKLDAVDRPVVRSGAAAASIVETLVERLSDEDNAASVPRIVMAFAGGLTPQFKDQGKLVWDPLVQAAFDILQSNGIGYFATGAAIDTLGLLRSRNKLAKTLVDRTFDEGRLAALSDEADNADEASLLADIAALMLLRGSDFAAPNGKSWADVLAERADFTDHVDSALTWYLWQESVTFALEALPTRASFAPVIWELARREIESNQAAGIASSYLLDNVETIENALGVATFEQAITNVWSREDFWPALEAIPLGRSFDHVVKVLGGLDGVDKIQLVELVRKRLESISPEGWRNAILEGVTPIGLAEIYRSELGETKSLGEELRSALADQASAMLTVTSPIRQRWFTLAQFVSKSARATLFRKLRDALLAGSEVKNLEDLMNLGGAQLLQEGKFAGDADKTARHIVYPLAQSEDGRELIMVHIDFFSAIVGASDTETKTALRELLTDADESSEATSALSLLCSALTLD